ncbi:hypothetical protein [Rubellicoccus peritrichatus]|uniref:Uncharacterized protein n=1 Tax=Rubellicoccus peritrichatus TaxID=3080537 RepID=A0AAQ3LFA4_9BACT|nr:hypothetical protein [Puniceicoccus sp. CR14]WOO40909.1 hypothetical protein RZN69_19985 [Puniceicoccus sp. CR14]
MIKEPQFLDGTQDIYDRCVYVIRPKEELIDFILKLRPGANENLNYFRIPTAVMTEAVPFEQDLEGWRIPLKNKCKEAYLRENINEFPLCEIEKPEGLLENMDTLICFFDKWWVAEEADHIEIVKGCWKTRECYDDSQ